MKFLYDSAVEADLEAEIQTSVPRQYFGQKRENHHIKHPFKGLLARVSFWVTSWRGGGVEIAF